MTEIYDLLIIGGGINGCGIARDAAGRGLKVLLCDKGDLGGATSSSSTKLIHGGLRYLQYGEFKLVRESLREREILLKAAPHLVRPLRFVIPLGEETRPAWMLRAGLTLYDMLAAGGSLPSHKGLRLAGTAEGRPLKEEFTRGFAYYDAAVDDARLVIANAMDARLRGAWILSRTTCISAKQVESAEQPDRKLWQVSLVDAGGWKNEVMARVVVNAAGPWAEEVLRTAIGKQTAHKLRLVQGSHLIFPRLYDHDAAYLLQQPDGRVVFAIPYEEQFTLVGTTEMDVQSPEGGGTEGARVTDEEANYLCNAVGNFLRRDIRPEQALWRFWGVRPLVEQKDKGATALSRDYMLELEAAEGAAPLLTIWGGKLTTYRHLAEVTLAKLSPWLNSSKGAWTAKATLPGGDITDTESYLTDARRRWPWLPKAITKRWVMSYGTLSEKLMDNAHEMKALGQHFGAGLYEAEMDYLRREEWAMCAEDVLWRRTKLGLHMTVAEREAAENWTGS